MDNGAQGADHGPQGADHGPRTTDHGPGLDKVTKIVTITVEGDLYKVFDPLDVFFYFFF